MTEDPNVVWLQTDPAGILYKAAPDPAQNAWHAGHVNDVIALEDGGILIATDSGGVWTVAADGTNLPLTDNQDNPDITCLAFGPFGPQHIYAGTRHDLWGAADSLYETDPTAILPLLSWRSVPLPSGVGTIYRIGVLKASRRIVLACDGGVYWSPIPPPGGSYNWSKASGIPAVSYMGLAVGDHESVAVAASGSPWDSWFIIPAPFVQFTPGHTVSVVVRDINHIEIFAIDIFGGIYSIRWDGGWQNWFRIGNFSDTATGSVVAAVSRNPGHVDLFVVRSDGVYTTWWDQNFPGPLIGDWQNWFRIGNPGDAPPAGSTVTAVARGTGHVDLFVARSNGVYTTWWDEKFPGPLAGGWQPWFPIGTPADAPPAGSVVTALSRDSDHVDLFVVRADTSGVSRVYSTRWDASSPGPLIGGWQSWFSIGDATDSVPSGSVVTAVSRNSGHLDIFVVRSDGGIYSTWWDAGSPGPLNGQWQPWFRIGTSSNNVMPGSTVCAVSHNPFTLDIFVPSGNIWTSWLDPDLPGPLTQGWQAWAQVTGMVTAGPLTGASRIPSHMDLFVVGFDHQVYTTAWDRDQGPHGIFHGDWASGSLVLSRSLIPGVLDGTKMRRIDLAACAQHPNNMYAVIAGATDILGDRNSAGDLISRDLYAVLQSADGGLTWSIAGGTTRADSIKGLRPTGDSQNLYNTCLGVSPVDPNVLAIGWRRGPMISTDGGNNWVEHGDDGGNNGSPHLMSDCHVAYFDPTEPTGHRLYSGCDGGLAMSPDLGTTWFSNYNRELRNLQFCSNPQRQAYGTLSASSQVSGPVGGGLQDNENVLSVWSEQPTPWTLLNVGGDGGLMLFIATGQFIYNGAAGPTQAGRWDGSKIQGSGTIPIKVPKPGGSPDPAGIPAPIAEVVTVPVFGKATGELMYAVCGSGKDIYGLFANRDGSDIHWEWVGSVPAAVDALGSYSGVNIFVGTLDGRMFALSPGLHVANPMSVLPGKSLTGRISRILTVSEHLAFAAFNVGDLEGLIMKLVEGRWVQVGASRPDAGLPNETFYALACDSTTATPTIFAATDTHLFSSYDLGGSFRSASQGLPARPHCADLRFVLHPVGVRDLYLSTFGRSVFRARLGFAHVPTPTALYMAWKGIPDDVGIYWSSAATGFDWLPEGKVPGVGTSAKPALAAFSGRLYMAWRGFGDDAGIYWSSSQDGMNWDPQTKVPGVGTSDGPALAAFEDRLYLAWKGADSDTGLWWTSTTDPAGKGWDPQQNVPGTGSSDGPALAVFQDRLYLAWKGADSDTGLWWSSTADPVIKGWDPQQNVPGTGSAHGPALAVFQNSLYLAWRGIPDDQGIFYSSKPDLTTPWAAQSKVPGVGTSQRPGLAALFGRLYLVWKGADSDTGIWWSSSLDGKAWDPQQNVSGTGTSSGPALTAI